VKKESIQTTASPKDVIVKKCNKSKKLQQLSLLRCTGFPLLEKER
jgi:hypothetical protein